MAQAATSESGENGPSENVELIERLEKKFYEINELLYTSSVPFDVLSKKVLPYIADDIIFKDPWQEGGNKHTYSIGMKGFHNMFGLTYDTYQVSLQLKETGVNGTVGRCMIDGCLPHIFPLRTIVVYHFRLPAKNDSDRPLQFQIFRHEEMWSYTEMIDSIPGIGWVYKRLFRPAFAYLFFGVSYLSCMLHDYRAEKSVQKHD